MKEVAALFEPEPAQWGLRGDPYVWRALAAHLTGTYLPPSAAEIESMLYAAFNRLVAVDLASDTNSSVYREEYAHGGLSSGHVSLDTWRVHLMPMLVERAVGRL
jgi:hypothetical protein